jgi:heme/copper-type cytochrome/quinol oxidase subunit 2
MNLITLACAACYGASDSSLAKGMNWGIFSLLGVVVFVLASIAGFFVYLGVRSSAHNNPGAEEAAAAEPTD